jgi:Family of unknown function (DUF5681)
LAGDGPKNYEIGYRKPPVATRFKIGNNAKPRGRPRGSTNLAAMLRHALDAPAVNPDGKRRRRPTKRELMIRSLVERSAGADLAATKLLFELLRKADPQAVAAEPATIGARGEDALTLLKERLARLARAQAADPPRAAAVASAVPPAVADPPDPASEADPADRPSGE